VRFWSIEFKCFYFYYEVSICRGLEGWNKNLKLLQMSQLWVILFLLPHALTTLAICYRVRIVR
jgi:hypothetical protein